MQAHDTWLDGNPVNYAEWLSFDKQNNLSKLSTTKSQLSDLLPVTHGTFTKHPQIHAQLACTAILFENSRTKLNMFRISCSKSVEYSVSFCELQQDVPVFEKINTFDSSVNGSYQINNNTLRAPECNIDFDLEVRTT